MKNLKKVIALVAVFAMMVSTVAFAATFTDVAETDSYYEAIETLNKLSILTGDPADENGDAAFRPNDTITRAEVAAIVCRMQGMNNLSQQNTSFSDVPSTHWASGYIATAESMQIINGYGDGNFGPEDPVLYEQAVKMMMETIGYKPYAMDQGGYPTGYMTAAQRYNVLNGVVGGSIGAEANRGMVAQMTFNAIDTPMMDRYSFASDATYIIYDGTNGYNRRTLLNSALDVSKLRGQITQNNITSFEAATDVDTSSASTIRLYVDDNYDDETNYYEGESYEFYTGESDADSLIGYTVNVYVREDTSNDYATVVSVTPATGRNTVAEFTLDQYDGLDGNYLRYMKNSTDRTATRLNIQSGATIFYNGIAYDGTLESMFGDRESGLVRIDSQRSGKVTALDSDNQSGYDVIFVEIAATGVVEDLSERGILTFKNTVGESGYSNNIRRVEFDADDTTSIINVTQDGEAYDYTQLKEWDVVTIIYNSAQPNVYDIRVLGESAIQGTITEVSSSDTSADNKAYRIGDNRYDVAADFYSNGTLRAGSAGTFYIDEYGKLVAYDRTNLPDGSTGSISDNYAYVLDAVSQLGTWNDGEVTLQVIDKDGRVWQSIFASTVTIENAYYNDTLRTLFPELTEDDPDINSFKIADEEGTEGEDIAEALVGQMITYRLDSNNYFRTITLPTEDNADNAGYTLTSSGLKENVEYDEEDMSLGNVDLNDTTKVFFINDGAGTAAPGTTADRDESMVGSVAELAEDTYNYIAYDVDENSNIAAAVVVYNKTVGISPATGLAYIISVGTANVDDDQVFAVRYYQDGEEQYRYTDPDLDDTDLNENTVPGSIFKFGIQNDRIKNVQTLLTFDGTVRDEITSWSDKAGQPNVKTFEQPSNSKEATYFGAVVEKTSNTRVYIQPVDETGILDLSVEPMRISLSGSDIEYYLYDPELSRDNRFDLGSAGDISKPDAALLGTGEDDSEPVVDVVIDGVSGSHESPVYGMMEYLFVREYDGDVMEVVIYLAHDYKYNFAD